MFSIHLYLYLLLILHLFLPHRINVLDELTVKMLPAFWSRFYHMSILSRFNGYRSLNDLFLIKVVFQGRISGFFHEVIREYDERWEISWSSG